MKPERGGNDNRTLGRAHRKNELPERKKGHKMMQTETNGNKGRGKIAQYSVLLYPRDVEAATAKAKEQGLSFSSLVRELVAQYVEKGGKDGNRK